MTFLYLSIKRKRRENPARVCNALHAPKLYIEVEHALQHPLRGYQVQSAAHNSWCTFIISSDVRFCCAALYRTNETARCSAGSRIGLVRLTLLFTFCLPLALLLVSVLCQCHRCNLVLVDHFDMLPKLGHQVVERIEMSTTLTTEDVTCKCQLVIM